MNKKVKLKYQVSTKRTYMGVTFPNATNILEVSEELADCFLRMKVGRDRLWEKLKEPKTNFKGVENGYRSEC